MVLEVKDLNIITFKLSKHPTLPSGSKILCKQSRNLLLFVSIVLW
jgi:hypothetical protein